MLRFSKNRWWTLILALSLCLASTATQPTVVRASGPSLTGDGDPSPAPESGDPDGPTGPSKTRSGGGALTQDIGMGQVRTVGDGRIEVRVVMWRLLLVVRSLRSFYFRF